MRGRFRDAALERRRRIFSRGGMSPLTSRAKGRAYYAVESVVSVSIGKHDGVVLCTHVALSETRGLSL